MSVSKENYQEALKSVTEHPKKRAFFQDYAFEQMNELRLSIRAGGLAKDNLDTSPFKGWRSTPEHEIIVSLETDILCEMLGIPAVNREKLRRNAVIHDWTKAIGKGAVTVDGKRQELIDFSKSQLKIKPDEELLIATVPAFLDKLESGEATLHQKILFYCDDIAKGSEVALLEDRINEVRQRNPNNDWDKEIRLATAVQTELTELANKNGANIQSPEALPIHILQRMKERLDNFQR